MKVLGVIPARLKSTRLPEKMLAQIKGKPLIYYTWKQAKKVSLLDEVIVATDAAEIFKAVEGFGGTAIMTSPAHKTGSDRVAEAVRKFKKFKPDIVVNIQGDEPVISPSAIHDAAKVLIKDKTVQFGGALAFIKNKADVENPSVVKVVVDKDNRVLYASRSVIPYPRNPHDRYFKQLGIYAYRPEALQKYVRLPSRPLELAESLEQLRIFESGFSMKVAVGNYKSVSVDTPQDLKRVTKLIMGR